MCTTSAGTGMIIGAEIILEGEVGVRVESDMDVTGTQRGIIIVVAGVAATVLMITGGVAGTGTHIYMITVVFCCIILYVIFNKHYWLPVEALVVAGAAATVLRMTTGVAEPGKHIWESTLFILSC
jgi:hypothetical protein